MIELILVITVLGILAVMALPMFQDVSSSAKTSARDGVIGAIKGGINMYRANALTAGTLPVVPAALDAQAAGVTCATAAPCFVNVLQDGITLGNWVKSAVAGGTETYTWAATVGGAVVTTCTYTIASGAFSCS